MRNELTQTIPRSYRQKVLAQAALCLPAPPTADFSQVPNALRRFLKIEDRRLRMSHEGGASGRQTAVARSLVLDLVVEYAFHCAIETVRTKAGADHKDGCAIVATGGYGRGELAPFSDLDLLFLYSGSRLSQMKEVAANFLRLLWDAGLSVGHSFRTVGDCVTSSVADPHLRTALVKTHLVAGSKALHNSLEHWKRIDAGGLSRYWPQSVASEKYVMRGLVLPCSCRSRT
jgi:[protein-PII] uridylyltransferase